MCDCTIYNAISCVAISYLCVRHYVQWFNIVVRFVDIGGTVDPHMDPFKLSVNKCDVKYINLVSLNERCCKIVNKLILNMQD